MFKRLALASVAAIVVVGVACSSESPRGDAFPIEDADGGSDDGSGPGQFGDASHCVNLECKQVACAGGGTTRITGKVVAPTLTNPDPIPGVSVYVPNAKVDAFSAGAECTTCASALSGQPVVKTVTGTDGTFTLENVPVGTDIPVVIQTGRWRRQVVLPTVTACTDNPLPAELSHLPRTKAEGDIPKMALATGSQDPLECMLLKLLDVSEITAPSGTGRVHLYHTEGNDMTTPLPARAALVGDAATLKGYDAVLLPCPGHYNYSDTEATNLKAYADQGGRIFNTHGGGFWMFEPTNFYPGLAQFNNQPDPGSATAIVDQTFPRGVTFAAWLKIVGASTTLGELPLGAPQWFVDSVSAPAQRWVYTQAPSPVTVQHFTFNTPVGVPDAQQCGRVLFSNFHAGSASGVGNFPAVCTAGPLSQEERIIEFMLFDVTACVQPDSVPR